MFVGNVVFRDGDKFCNAFAGAQVNLSYHEWRTRDMTYSRYFFNKVNINEKIELLTYTIFKMQTANKVVHTFFFLLILKPFLM